MRGILRMPALLLVLLAMVAACGPRRTGGTDERAQVIFTNQSLAQATLYAVRGGAEIRIGTILPGRTDTLFVPRSVTGGAGNVSFVARLLAKNVTPRSGPVPLLPGDVIAIRLPSTETQLIVLPP